MIVSIAAEKIEAQEFKNVKRNPVYPFVNEEHDSTKDDENIVEAISKMDRTLARENYYYEMSRGFGSLCFNDMNPFVAKSLAEEAKKYGLSIGDETSKGVKKKITYEKYLGYCSKAETRNRK